jgi:N-carbamoylputrescine amidase
MNAATKKVAIIQQTASSDKQKSLQETRRLALTLQAHNPDIILLQELHATHYFCQTEDAGIFDLAEPLDGPTFQTLSALARELASVIVGSIFEKRAPGIFHNTALVIERDGSLAGIYRKMHIPDDPGFYEKYYFTPGDAIRNDGSNGFTPVTTSAGRLGVLVCWDQWYPEAARLMALAGADLLLYPTAIGWDPHDTPDEHNRQNDAWVTIQRAHAVANHLPVLVANRVGHEACPAGGSGTLFWGTSFIAGPQGEFLAKADTTSSCVLTAEISTARTEQLRRIWPYFRDRRIDAYGDILRRHKNS